MAYNIADLFEHAVDYFPDRLAVACGDDEVTYAELEERANRLAHHLADHGVGAGSHVGMCTRNRLEAIVTMLAVYKLRAALINVNYRYTANEIQLRAGQRRRRRAGARAAVRRPGRRGAARARRRSSTRVVIEDESDLSFTGDVLRARRWRPGRPERDFEERSGDDLYLLYTGGTTGMPKGVMWRHEDVWRTLGGGINFMTGEPLESEFAQAEMGKVTGGMVRLCLAPLIHGNAQWAGLMALFGGDTVVLLTQFDPVEVWKAIERRKVNVIVLIGDAMARPMIEAFTARRLRRRRRCYAISSSAALFSQSVKNEYLEGAARTRSSPTRSARPRPASWASGMITKDSEQGIGGPRVSAGNDTIVIDEDGKPIPAGVRATSAGWPAAATSRSATTRTRRRRPGCSSRSTASATRCPATSPGTRPTARSPCSGAATPA